MTEETSFSDNPRITFALIKLEDELIKQLDTPDADFTDITTYKDEVLKRYQPIFSISAIPKLTKADFVSFLLYRNNHHWDGLQRIKGRITRDMNLLQEALSILLDESRPIQVRLNELLPDRNLGGEGMVPYLGRPVLTAILLVGYPEKYGVWNNTSDAGLKIVRLWDKRWEVQPVGETYLEMNALYLYFAEALKIDLWTLDALWWTLKKGAK